MIDCLLVWFWKQSRKIILWGLWLILVVGLSLYFYDRLAGDNQTLFIPGVTSHGHYQIEVECTACHEKESFKKIKQAACLGCHKEKKKADSKSNSHRAKLFEAEDKADQQQKIAADRCITCHKEHQIGYAGTTQPKDFCILCHDDIADDRESHKDLAFDRCDDCHQYHDNTANYSKGFIAKHINDQDNTFEHSKIPQRNFLKYYKKKQATESLSWLEHDAPSTVDLKLARDWEGSSHAKVGVNCQGCHNNSQKQWQDKPVYSMCKSCHKKQVKGFLASKHGMRLGQSLSAMTTDQARLPMKHDSQRLNCNACHQDHRFDTVNAEVESCLNCHDDQHSLAYKESKHYQLWLNKDPLGVSCATCHLPRTKKGKKVFVQHNQNENLRPRQKMIKTVCVSCHGLGFSLDALNETSLIDNNFLTSPSQHIPMLEMWQKFLNK